MSEKNGALTARQVQVLPPRARVLREAKKVKSTEVVPLKLRVGRVP